MIDTTPRKLTPNEKEDLLVMSGVPKDKVQPMKDYALKLHKKFPHMKKARLMRKVAEEFKVHLT